CLLLSVCCLVIHVVHDHFRKKIDKVCDVSSDVIHISHCNNHRTLLQENAKKILLVSQTYTIENDRLILDEKGKNGGANSRIERYVEGDKLYIVCECNGVKSTRIYERMKE
ncbi:hypothetical protein GCK32_003108, partial [Trichostrongylus colubriformis]